MNKKGKIIFLITGIILFIFIAVCFTIALINHKSGKTESSKDENDEPVSEQVLSSSTITTGGTYKLEGDETCVVVNTSNDVELELNNSTITCENGPAINIVNANSITIKITGDNKITATTTETLDGAIYSKEDLTLTGDGKLTITSNYDGIVSKDNLTIISGEYIINSKDDGIRGKDSVEISNGSFKITAGGDGIKSTNDTDESKGYINITGGTFDINAVNDGIQAETNLKITNGTFTIKTTGNTNNDSSKGLKAGTLITLDGGKYTITTTDDGIHSNGNITINKGDITITSNDDGIHADGMINIKGGTSNITAKEGIEATYVKIDDGTISISASDDGINAGNKSNAYSVKIEITGGNITIKMGQGDTDGIDSNGDLYISDGTINITGQSPFDYDGTAKYTGGTIIVNGQTTNSITNQQMGGGMGGPGRQGGMGNPGENRQRQGGYGRR